MTISEVSELTGLSKDTLRYYEKIGIIPEIGRNKSGIRIYNDYNLQCIKFSKSMRDLGISLDSIIKYIKLYQKGKNTCGAAGCKKVFADAAERAAAGTKSN